MDIIKASVRLFVVIALHLFILNADLSATFVSEIPHQLDNCPILLQVDYSETGTDWDIYQIQTVYPNSVENNGYLIFDKVYSNTNIPYDITVRYAVGENQQVFAGVLETVPEAFWALVGTGDNHPWEDAAIRGITATDIQTIWDNGYKLAVEPSVKLTYLYYILYSEYKSWIENNIISSLSFIDAFLLPDARIKNNCSNPIISIFASIRAKWRDFYYPYQAGMVDAWWPKGSVDDTGTASWGFDITVLNRVGPWLSDTFVYGDNGTTQTIYWDNTIKATHQNYGFIQKIESLNTSPPISVKLEQTNVWSGNHNYLTMTFLADDVIFSNLWESPSVGDTPIPRKIIFLPGWNNTPLPTEEREALDIFYVSTNGLSWTNSINWLGIEGTEETWFGISTAMIGGELHVIGVDLKYNNLQGALPTQMTQWPNLCYLNLKSNNITGGIPTWIGDLTELKQLDFTNNTILGGTIPETMGNLISLEILALSGCNLSGAIPIQLNNMTALQQLAMANNNLTGPIPDLRNLTNLWNINLGNNNLTGSLPEWIGNLTNLMHLKLYYNSNLTGPIPDSILNLTNLITLDIRGTALTLSQVLKDNLIANNPGIIINE